MGWIIIDLLRTDKMGINGLSVDYFGSVSPDIETMTFGRLHK